MKYDVFISYRREGGFNTAKHLNDLLVRDGYRVSFDIDTLRSGDFDTQLLDRIDECKDFILIVDPHTFDRTLDGSVSPKKDWLRCELAYALQKDKNIIPIFLSGVHSFPEGLPEDIVKVERKNGPPYDQYYFDGFYNKLKNTFLLSKPASKQDSDNTTVWSKWKYVFIALLGVNVFLLLDTLTAFICPITYESAAFGTTTYHAYAMIDFDVLFGISKESMALALKDLREPAGTCLVFTLIGASLALFGLKSCNKKTRIVLALLSFLFIIGFFWGGEFC